MRWVSVLLLEGLDGRSRARALMTGALAAVSTGFHDKIIPWSEEAAALSFGDEAIVNAVTTTFHATPMMVRQPLRAAELLAVAAQVATAPGLALTRALINSYTLMAEFCAEQPTQPVVALLDAPRFGGQHSASWTIAASLGMIVVAMAGDPEQARRVAVSFIAEVDRTSDVVWHGELVLLLGILALRTGNTATALTYFEAAKRAPMFFPFWYALAHRYSAQARDASGDIDAIAAAIELGKSMSVETILDRELRGRATSD